ncbi:MAG: hypothetical protein KKD73_09300 [Proteobacteria bacterium]|nr:hypothetical protein [Pseudomonadota bacterium]MBU1641642.1 hypothetical protein [Pseudomonadota bacterium]
MKLVDSDLIGVGLLLVLFASVIVIAELWTRMRRPAPELPRKFIHIFGGLGCLLFPFLIDSPLVVTGLASLFALTFVAGQKSSMLQSLSSVERKSRGSEYFPISVALLFYICQEHLWLYLSSLLILSFADAAAALIGCRFGTICYKVGPTDSKSLQGSLAFFVITFAVIFGLLSTMTDLALLNCSGAAFLAAVLLTGIEAVSIHGTDNIFIPVLTCYILLKITSKPFAEILFQCISIAVIFSILIVFIRIFKIFSVRDSIIFQLFAYATWSLGSTDWSLPIFTAFFLYSCSRALVANNSGHEIATPDLLRVLAVPLFLLVVANASGRYQELYGPFLMATIIAFTCSTWLYISLSLSLTALRYRLFSAALSLCAPLLFVFVGKFFHSPTTPFTVLVPLVLICLLTTYCFSCYLRARKAPSGEGTWSRFILLCSGGGATGYLAVQTLALVPYWQPAF